MKLLRFYGCLFGKSYTSKNNFTNSNANIYIRIVATEIKKIRAYETSICWIKLCIIYDPAIQIKIYDTLDKLINHLEDNISKKTKYTKYHSSQLLNPHIHKINHRTAYQKIWA